MPTAYKIRPANPEDFDLLVEDYLSLWDSYDVPREHHRSDAGHIIRSFLAEAAAQFELGAFICEYKGIPIASACCQVRRSPYPEILKEPYRKIGYVWSVYISADHQKQGLGSALMSHCLDHLRHIGCTSVVLHSSDAGQRLYQKLGFTGTDELGISWDD